MAQKGFQEDMVSQGAGGLPLIIRDMEQRLVRVTDTVDRDTALTQFYEAALQEELDKFSLAPEEAVGILSALWKPCGLYRPMLRLLSKARWWAR